MTATTGQWSRSLGRNEGGRSPRPSLLGVDWSLVLAVMALVAIGGITIYSATRGPLDDRSFVTKQAIFAAVGGGLAAAVAWIDFGKFREWLGIGVVATVVALVAVLTPLGTEINGSQAWFRFGGFTVQPAEFTKLTLIVALAAVFTNRRSDDDGVASLRTHLAAAGIFTLLAGLVFLEGETGSLLVYGCILLAVLLLAGTPVRWIVALVLAGVISVSLLLSSGALEGYREDRLLSFLNPDADPQSAGYQVRQSLNAIGSGGLGGQGLFDGPVTQLRFLPEQQTDFIFAVIAEELGFIGAATVLALEAFVLFRILRIAQLARNPFGSLLCGGVFAMLLYQVAQNAGMNMSLGPVTGIPLPFVSYGGSSLITSLIAIGIVQSVAIHRYRVGGP